MKPLFALVRAASVLAAGLLLSASSAEAAFFLRSGMTTQALALPVQYGQWSPDRTYSPGRRQNSIAARAAYCRCYPYGPFQRRLVCRNPAGGTTVRVVDHCY